MNPLLEAEVDIDVPFHDLDPMQIVWHGRYAQYFEIARCALLDQIGYGYDAMRESGYAWPIIDMRIQYVQHPPDSDKSSGSRQPCANTRTV